MFLRREAVKYLTLAVIAIAVWLVMVVSFWPGQFAEGDNLTYAILARNMARGSGLVHQSIVPQLLANLGKLPDTDVRQPPGWPLVEAGIFKILGVSDLTMMMASGIFWVLGLLLIFKITKKLFSEKSAWLGVAMYLFQPMVLRLSYSGLTEPFYIFLLLLVVDWLVISKHGSYLGTGLVLGLMKWTRSSTLFLLPAVFWVMWKKKVKAIDFLASIAGFGLVEFAFNWWRLGSEGGYYSSTLARSSSEILTLLRDFNVYPAPSVVRLFGRLKIEMLLGNLGELWWLWIFVSYACFIWLLFVLGILRVKSKERQAVLFVEFTVIAFVANWIGSTISEPSPRYAAPLIALSIPIAAMALNGIIRKVNTLNKYLLLLIVIAFPFALSISREYYRMHYDIWLSEAVRYVGQANTGAIVTDQPVRFAWYTDSQMIFFPHNMDQVREIDRKIVPISGVLLTKDGLEQNHAEDGWRNLFKETDEKVWYENGIKEAVFFKL